MKITVAIDSLKGSLASMEAGNAAKDGILRVYPEAEVFVRPLADGGEGTVDALTEGLGGRIRTISVSDPLGRPLQADYGILTSPGQGEPLAVIEMAAASGLPLLAATERNPLRTTTYGVGELILDAIRQGCRRFLIASAAAPPTTADSACSPRWDINFSKKTERPSPRVPPDCQSFLPSVPAPFFPNCPRAASGSPVMSPIRSAVQMAAVPSMVRKKALPGRIS